MPCSIKNRFHGFLRVLCAWFAVNVLLILAATSFSSGWAHAAEFSLRPGITVSEEYNDNIFLTTTGRVSDSVTRTMPSVNLHYKTDLWDWDVNYAYDYRYYARGKREDDKTQTANAGNKTELIKNFFFIELRDQYSRVSLDAARDFTNESQFVNQSDRNVYSVNPYLMLQSDLKTTAKLGYRYINTWYKDPAAVNTTDHIGYIDATIKHSPRTTFTMGAQFTRELSELLPFDQTDVHAGSRFVYAPNCSIFFTAGNTWFVFGEDRHATQAFWRGGITHQYSTLTASLETGLSFIPDPVRGIRREDRYAVTVGKKTERTDATISGSITDYRDAETKRIENTTSRVGGTMKYALTPRSSISLDLATELRKDYEASTTQDLLFSGVRLEHRAAEHLTLALQYRYTDSYAPETFEINYYNNRALFEITMIF